MTVLNPKPIIEKLEKTGLAEVKKKLALGKYRVDKRKIVEKWIGDKERELAVAAKAKTKAIEPPPAPPKVKKPQQKAPPKTKAKKPAKKAPAKRKPAAKKGKK